MDRRAAPLVSCSLLVILVCSNLAAAFPSYFAGRAGGDCTRHPSSSDGSRLGQHTTGSLGSPDQGIVFAVTDDSGAAVPDNQVCAGATYSLRVSFPSSHYLLTSSRWTILSTAVSACNTGTCAPTRFCAQSAVGSGTHTFTVPCPGPPSAGQLDTNVFRVTRADGWMAAFRSNTQTLTVKTSGCPSLCTEAPPPAPPKAVIGLPKSATLALAPAAGTNRKTTLAWTARLQGFTAAEAAETRAVVTYSVAGRVNCTVGATNTKGLVPTARVTCTAVAAGRTVVTVAFGTVSASITINVRRT